MDWINSKDQLPKYNELVLIYANPNYYVGYRAYTDKDGEHWTDINHSEMKRFVNIEFWIKLPEPPL